MNALDPVSPREIARNNAIYIHKIIVIHTLTTLNMQRIWNPTADTQAPTAPTNLVATGTSQTTTNLSWTASTDNGYNRILYKELI
jgi:hypothetical protein